MSWLPWTTSTSGKRPVAVGIPDAAVDRERLRLEAPEPAPLARRLRRQRDEARRVHRRRADGDRIAVFRPPAIGAAAVGERADGIRTGLPRITRLDRMVGEHLGAVVAREVERLRAGEPGREAESGDGGSEAVECGAHGAGGSGAAGAGRGTRHAGRRDGAREVQMLPRRTARRKRHPPRGSSRASRSGLKVMQVSRLRTDLQCRARCLAGQS